MSFDDRIILDCLIVGMIETNCYIYGCKPTKEIAIIDPGDNALQILSYLKEHEYTAKMILLTHEHFDHTSGVSTIKETLNIPIYASKSGKFNRKLTIDKYINEGDVIEIGDIKLNVLDSPGHSPGGLIYADYDNKLLFVGDSVFQGSIGRTDFGGNYDQLMISIKQKIMHNPKIDDSSQIFPGHGPNTSVGIEKRINPFRKDFL
jgi:glyoxylase-like metal-dependent hydrolase (beta-lactamase superfamily II)